MSDQCTVLVVDDESLFRLNLRVLLEDMGFRVMEAANGLEALEEIGRELPDLVLTDLRMPEMNGLSLISVLAEEIQHLPVVVVSGIGDLHDAIESVRLGAWDYITKPIIDQKAFEIVVNRALERARLMRENLRYREGLEEQVRQRTVELETANRRLVEEVAERAEQEARISSFVNNAPGFFYTLVMRPDGSLAIPFASAGIKELFDVDPEEVQKEIDAFTAMTHPGDQEMTLRKTLESARRLTPFHVEYRIIHPAKGERWMECRSVPQREPDGGTRWYGFMHDITDRKWAEEQLREKQQHLNAMTLELSLAEERERRAIATELHDQIGQDLTLAKIKLGVLARDHSSGHADRLLNETREILDSMIHDVRALTHRISPPILAGGSLEAALKWLSRQVGSDYGLDIRFSDDMSEKQLSEEFRAVIYHAVRELLINAAKHAQAETVRVTVGRTADSFLVVVADDGAGFDPVDINENRTIGDGFGLFNVRRRIRHLGGEFSIESSAGSGTRVTIGMPLTKNNTHHFHKEEN